jgi:hypothetical protein
MIGKHLLLGISGTAAAVAAVTTASVAIAMGGGQAAPQRLTAAHVRSPVTCGQPRTVMGYVGLSRAGQDTAIRHALGSHLLAAIGGAQGITTVLVAPSASPKAAQQRLSARLSPVYPQARESRLRSCSMRLSDRPAARVLVKAAVRSFVRAGFFTSAAAAWSRQPQVLVSDDPVAAGSVIVTFSAIGPVVNPQVPAGTVAGPHPPLHGLITYTAIVTKAGAAVTGVAKGGF